MKLSSIFNAECLHYNKCGLFQFHFRMKSQFLSLRHIASSVHLCNPFVLFRQVNCPLIKCCRNLCNISAIPIFTFQSQGYIVYILDAKIQFFLNSDKPLTCNIKEIKILRRIRTLLNYM